MYLRELTELFRLQVYFQHIAHPLYKNIYSRQVLSYLGEPSFEWFCFRWGDGLDYPKKCLGISTVGETHLPIFCHHFQLSDCIGHFSIALRDELLLEIRPVLSRLSTSHILYFPVFIYVFSLQIFRKQYSRNT